MILVSADSMYAVITWPIDTKIIAWFLLYKILSFFRDKLASMKLSRYKDDLLFFMFYNNVGDVLQIAAASEL